MKTKMAFTLLSVTFMLGVHNIALANASEQGKHESLGCGFAGSARFVEGAPRDRFIIENRSAANWHIGTLVFDLGTSAGNLIFDITAEGAGVDVFQPFRDDGGTASLAQNPTVTDGDQSISLVFASFMPGDDYRFSIDIDDQLSNSDLGQIRVSSGEMAGAMLSMQISDKQGTRHTVSGEFDSANQVTLDMPPC